MADESGHGEEQHDQLSASNQSNNAYDSIDPSQTVIRPASTPTPQPPSGPEILADGRSTGPADQPGRPDGGFGPASGGWGGGGGSPSETASDDAAESATPESASPVWGIPGPSGRAPL